MNISKKISEWLESAHLAGWKLLESTEGVAVNDFRRSLKETMLEMEVSIREEYGVNAAMIKNRLFSSGK